MNHSTPRKLNIGTVEEFFRTFEEDMSDSEDAYLIEAAEKFEINQQLKDEDDQICIKAIEQHEKSLQYFPKKSHPIDSQKEILKKSLHAKVALRHTLLSVQNLNLLADHFFHPLNWPTYALQILFTKDFSYQERMTFALFFVGNGLLDPLIAQNIFIMHNGFWCATKTWERRLTEFRRLFDYFNKPMDDPNRNVIRGRYWYYDIQTNRNLYLNGNKKEKTR